MARKINIAIDGPVGSGKSTIARLTAKQMGYTYIDTGAMYRGVALKAARSGISWDAAGPMSELAENTAVDLKPSDSEDLTCRIAVDGTDVSREIRQTEIGQGASKIGTIAGVREALVKEQQRMARAGGVVMEGRDIGTVVLPGAELKIFLTGSVEERARRRYLELQRKGQNTVMADVVEEVRKRDEQDSTRKESPLKKADDAVEVDTTGMTIEQVVDSVVRLARERSASYTT
jgi:cytidylate kinase